MKILISGATGFIGKSLTEKLLDKKHNLCVIVRPSTETKEISSRIKKYTYNGDIDDLILFMQKEKFDGVIHLASLFLAQHSPKNIPDLINSNVLFSTLLLEASVKSNVSWFINTGSFNQHYKNKKYSPVNLYAATKQAFEILAQYYIETTAINFVTIKLYDTFGPGDTRQKIFNLWAKISKTGETLDMSLGRQLIHINYIDDIVSAYLAVIKNVSRDKKRLLSGKSFAPTSSQIMPLRDLALLFEKVTKKKLNINWGAKEYRPREVMIPWNKGEKIPDWRPVVTIEKGIKKMLGDAK